MNKWARTAEVYPDEKLFPETDLSLLLRRKFKGRPLDGCRDVVLPVCVANGKQIGRFSLMDLNELFGKGWFRCFISDDNRTLQIVLAIEPYKFWQAMEFITCRELMVRDQQIRDQEAVAAEGRRRKLVALDHKLRSAREGIVGGTFTEEDWQALLIACDHRCLRCGSKNNLTRDHIVPLSCRGSNSIDNAQVLCRRCNAWKGVRTIDFRDNRLKKSA